MVKQNLKTKIKYKCVGVDAHIDPRNGNQPNANDVGVDAHIDPRNGNQPNANGVGVDAFIDPRNGNQPNANDVGVDALIDPRNGNQPNANDVGVNAHIDPRNGNQPNANDVGVDAFIDPNNKNKNGITLIALIITIIILLILAGVTINLTIGENGLFRTAKQAVDNYINAQEQELGLLNETVNTIEAVLGGNQQDSEMKKGVNKPKITKTGLTPVTINSDGSLTEVEETDDNWYEYVDTSKEGKTNTSKWANAKTKDGSLWVWIPRYAYKITYTDANDKSAGGTIDIVFLKGITNLDEKGNDVTSENYVDENGNTGAYIVHPAFQDGEDNGFPNGEWDSEITGFWVAKFEAGYDGTAGDSLTAIDSNVALSTIYSWNGSTKANVTTNYYGTRAVGSTIKYPVFKANRPSMNYLGRSDAYDLCLDIKNGSVYGLSNVDSHMMKNSEWGAVAYLTHSKYGRNGNEVTINNVSANGSSTIYAVTGYGGSTVGAGTDTSRTLTTLLTEGQSGSWTTTQGQTASSTGNIYGIYDLSGGAWEWTAGYVATEESYGGSLKGESTKYKSKYAGTSSTDTTNYNTSPNPTRLGEAIWETSTAGGGASSWNGDQSRFWLPSEPSSIRGGGYYRSTSAGVFAFYGNLDYCTFTVGFRPVLVAE